MFRYTSPATLPAAYGDVGVRRDVLLVGNVGGVP